MEKRGVIRRKERIYIKGRRNISGEDEIIFTRSRARSPIDVLPGTLKVGAGYGGKRRAKRGERNCRDSRKQL